MRGTTMVRGLMVVICMMAIVVCAGLFSAKEQGPPGLASFELKNMLNAYNDQATGIVAGAVRSPSPPSAASGSAREVRAPCPNAWAACGSRRSRTA